jgi:hypothetical protein
MEKLPAAIKKCPKADDDVKLWPKGKCPKMKGFLKYLSKLQAQTTCLGVQLGWIKGNSLDKGAMMADLAGLNPEVGAMLSSSKLDMCVNKKVNPMKKNMKKCGKKYKNKDKKQLEKSMSLLAGSKCMLSMLQDACYDYVDSKVKMILNMLLNM